MKKCTKCLEEKDENYFSSSKKGLHPWCKTCHSSYSKARYVNSGGKVLRRQKEQEANRKLEIERKVIEYLKANPCIDCGETDLLTLDFDHNRDKESNVATLIWHVASWDRIEDEIKKCDVRCYNCHRKKTARQLNSWKLKFL